MGIPGRGGSSRNCALGMCRCERLWPCTEFLRVLEFYLLEARRVEILGLVVRNFFIFNSKINVCCCTWRLEMELESVV